MPAGAWCLAKCLPGFRQADGYFDFLCLDNGSGFAWIKDDYGGLSGEMICVVGKAGMHFDTEP
jgi:hypothetical protein